MTSKNKDNKESNLSWADLAKKIVFTSLGSVTLARDVVKEGKDDMINGLLSKAEKRKDVIIEVLAREVSKFLGKINVSQEVIKSLKGLVINLNASIDFKEKGKGIEPRLTIRSAETKKTHSRS